MVDPSIVMRLEEAYLLVRQEWGIEKIPNKKAFAKYLDISYSQASSMFSGERKLTPKMANRMERTYGISSTWLLYGTGEKKVKSGQLSNESLTRYIGDSIIWHVAPGMISDLMAGDTSSLKCWSFPGLKGEFYSFSMFVRNNLYIPYASTVIAQEVDNKIAQPAERMYVIIDEGKIHFTGKPYSGERVFVVIGHVPPMLK